MRTTSSLFVRVNVEMHINLKITREQLNFQGKDLHNCKMRGANLSGANMSHANLAGSDFSEAYLTCTDLRGANLKGTVFNNTHFFPRHISNPKSVVNTCLNWYLQTYEQDHNLSILKPLIINDLIEILREFMRESPETHHKKIQYVKSLLHHRFLELPESHSTAAYLLAKITGYIEGAPSEPNFTFSQQKLANQIPFF